MSALTAPLCTLPPARSVHTHNVTLPVLTFIYLRHSLCFILVYNCGLTVRNRRICYVMHIQPNQFPGDIQDTFLEIPEDFYTTTDTRMHAHTHTV